MRNSSCNTSHSRGRSKCSLSLLGCLALTLMMSISGLAQGGYAGMSNIRLLWDDGDLLVMEGGMTIDADGAPEAYSPLPGQGLDALEHAGSPEHWDGIATRH